MFEKVIFKQLSEYMECYLHKFLCGFRKSHSTQHAVFNVLQKWQGELDKSSFVVTILMDLSKAYDCLPHDLIIAKFEAYGLDQKSLNLLLNYLENRQQRTRIGSSYSSWFDVSRGFPQGSTGGPLFFNVIINDIFHFVEKSELCNFADDNTLFSCGKSLDIIIRNLKYDMKHLIKWFKLNSLKPNPKKFQIMVLGNTIRPSVMLKIGSISIKETKKVTLLGITIDERLTFKDHISNVCRTANFKLHALRRIRSYISEEKAKILGDAFINSHFNYAAIIWMFCRKTLYKKIEKIHHKTLQVVYNSHESYLEILNKHDEVTIHQKHLRFFATEIYKSLNSLNPEFMKDFFPFKNTSYNFRKGNLLVLPQAKSTYFGTNSLLFRGSLLWNSLPVTIKNKKSLDVFKSNLKSFGNIDCNCVICR